MKLLVALVTAALCGSMTTACGTNHARASTRVSGYTDTVESAPAQPGLSSGFTKSRDGYVEGDDDQDMNLYDDRYVRKYGHAAAPVDRRVIAELLRRYFAAGLAGNGVKACSLLYPKLAHRADLTSSIPPDYASPGALALRGEPCARLVSRLFVLSRKQLALADISTRKVLEVRVSADRSHGLVVLASMRLPERQMAVQREGVAWKVDSLLDEEIP